MSDTVAQALITPRYLAGGGDPGWITVPLHRAAGWSYGHDPLTPRVLLTSPDQLIQLRLDPDPDDPGWWTIRHAGTADHPGWTATFEARTPVEIIAAFTDSLTDPSGPPTAAPDPCAPLRDAGWHTPPHLGSLASPDNIAHVWRIGAPGRDLWSIEAAVIQDPTIWRAVFTGTTPLHLIAAVTQSLADRTPIPRDPSRIPGLARDRMTVHTHHVAAPDIAFALERRVSALAARHRPATTAPPAPHGRSPRRTR